MICRIVGCEKIQFKFWTIITQHTHQFKSNILFCHETQAQERIKKGCIGQENIIKIRKVRNHFQFSWQLKKSKNVNLFIEGEKTEQPLNLSL